LANLECALNAREIRPDLRIVLRMFDQGLASKICSGFLIDAAFSTSALAAPALAMAAVDPAVMGSFLVGDDVMLTLEIEVARGSALDGMSTADLENRGRYSLLARSDGSSGERDLHPSGAVTFAAGDTLVIATEPDFARTLHELNQG
jgi:Trk K+ transport system NAD-binding subunit